jgi:outer membrane protein assembly factor BamB
MGTLRVVRRAAILVVAVALFVVATPIGGRASQTNSNLASFSLRSGRRLWVARPTKLHGGFQVVSGSDTAVLAVQGRCLWDDDTRYRKGSSALVAFDARTGSERWRIEDVGTGNEFLVPTLGTLPTSVRSMEPKTTIPITSASGDRLLGISVRDGSRVWTIPRQEFQAVAGDGAAFVLATGPLGTSSTAPIPVVAQVELVNARSGKVTWSTAVGNDTEIAGAALSGSSVALILRAAGSSDNRLVLLDRKSGKLRADTRLRDYVEVLPDALPGFVSLGAAGDTLVVSTGRTTIAVDGRDGRARWHRDDYDQAGPLSATTEDGTPVVFLSHWVYGNNTHPDRTEAIDAQSNQTLWTVPPGRFVNAAYGTNSLSMPDNLWHSVGTGSVVDSATGMVRWTSEFSDDQSLLATAQGLLVGGGCPTTLRD